MDLALKMADVTGFAKRKAESKKNGKLRGLGMSNTIERAAAAGFEGAEIRFDRGGTVQMFSGSINQGQGHETTFKQVVADKLGMHPDDIEYIQGDTDKVFFGEGTGGSRSATMSGSAFHQRRAKRSSPRPRRSPRTISKVDVADINFDEGIFSSTKTNQTMTIKDVAQDAFNPAKLPKDMEAGLFATAVYKADVENFPNGVHICEVEIDPETGEVEVVNYNVVDDVGTVMNPLLLKGQIVGGVAHGRRPDPEGGHQLRRRRPAHHRLVHGLRHAARPRLLRGRGRRPIRCRPRPIRSAPRAPAKPAASARMPAVANALVNALAEFGVKPHRDAGDAGAGVARDRTTGRLDKNNGSNDPFGNQRKNDLGRQGAGQRGPGRLHPRPHLDPAAGQSVAVLHEVPQRRPRRDHRRTTS